MAKSSPGLAERLVAIRRDLHRHPELSLEEHGTADRVAAELDALGMRYRRGVGGAGIIADLAGPAGVPAVALRADMDALPIHEETGLTFASLNPGVMHACGHDGHMTMVLGAAALLRGETELPAPVRLVFQPAEEVAIGAQAVIEDGALDGVGMIFGGHLDRHYPTGAIVVSAGTVNASTDEFTIRIRGQQAHAARPHESIDAVVAGSLIVMAIQTIVSREVDPAHPSVVSVGRFDAGTAPNVIAGQAVLQGTVRAQDPEVRAHLVDAIRRIAESTGQLHNAEVTVDISSGTPPVINTPDMAELARRAARGVVGAAHVTELHTANMGAEDFSFYLDHVPGCYVRFGSRVPGREGYPAHSSKFDFDEAALTVGAEYFANVARVAGEVLASG